MRWWRATWTRSGAIVLLFVAAGAARLRAERRERPAVHARLGGDPVRHAPRALRASAAPVAALLRQPRGSATSSRASTTTSARSSASSRRPRSPGSATSCSSPAASAMLVWLDWRLFSSAWRRCPPRRGRSCGTGGAIECADDGRCANAAPTSAAFSSRRCRACGRSSRRARRAREVARFTRLNDAFIATLMRLQRTALSGRRPAVARDPAPAPSAVFFYGGWRVVEGTLTLGTLAAFMAYQARVVAPVQALMGLYGALATARVSWRASPRCSTRRPKWSSGQTRSRSPAGATARSSSSEVTLSHGRGAAVLDGVSFRAEPGQTLAIVGRERQRQVDRSPTSLVRLLDPDAGDGAARRPRSAHARARRSPPARAGRRAGSGALSRDDRGQRPVRAARTRPTPTLAGALEAAGLARFVAGAAGWRAHDRRRPRARALGRRAAADGARARVSGRPVRARPRRAQRRARSGRRAAGHRRAIAASCAAGPTILISHRLDSSGRPTGWSCSTARGSSSPARRRSSRPRARRVRRLFTPSRLPAAAWRRPGASCPRDAMAFAALAGEVRRPHRPRRAHRRRRQRHPRGASARRPAWRPASRSTPTAGSRRHGRSARSWHGGRRGDPREGARCRADPGQGFRSLAVHDGRALAAAIRWAAAQQVALINLSLGTAETAHRPLLEHAVEEAARHGSIVVSAAPQNGTAWLPGGLAGVVGSRSRLGMRARRLSRHRQGRRRQVVRASGLPAADSGRRAGAQRQRRELRGGERDRTNGAGDRGHRGPLGHRSCALFGLRGHGVRSCIATFSRRARFCKTRLSDRRNVAIQDLTPTGRSNARAPVDRRRRPLTRRSCQTRARPHRAAARRGT